MAGRGQYWVPRQEDFITRTELFMVHEALAQGLEVMIDATNFNPAFLNRFHAIAKESGLTEVEHWLVHTHLALCIARNTNENREHHVDVNVIQSFYKKYRAYCHQNNIEIEPGTISKTIINI